MSVLVDSATRIICQGMTGRQGTFHTDRMMDYGSQIVGGVTPGKGGTRHLYLPVYDTVAAAMADTHANASIIFVPSEFASDAILDAIEAELELVVCVTEGIPLLDMVRVKQALVGSKTRLVGPNCSGVITPGECKIGIMPGSIFHRGRVGIISRSGTLAYEAVNQISNVALGQSTFIGIGADPIHGMSFVDGLELLMADPETDIVLLVGEIGGNEEEATASFLSDHPSTKPVVALVAGLHAPPYRRMGHAGAIIGEQGGGVREKVEALASAGVHLVETLPEIGPTIKALAR